MAAVVSNKRSQMGVLPAWEDAGGLVVFVFFPFKLLRVVSSEAFYCARSKKWVMVADLAPLIFHSKDAIHVPSAKSLPRVGEG